MNVQAKPVQRIVGFDGHPDSFTAALVVGPTPAAARVEKTFHKIPLGQLPSWAQKHTTAEDLFVLEASGNSFQIVRTLAAVGRQAKVCESCHLGKLKEAHANNDRISAVRIGKAYLSGTAKEVWVPDTRTQERRDLFHAHRKTVQRTTQLQSRLSSYLSDNGVRLPEHLDPVPVGPLEEHLRQTRPWSARQWQVIEGLLLELRHAHQQRQHWHSLIAQEVLADPQLLRLVELCGIRELVAFGLGAFIGDIHRFAHPKQLVKYVGLNPAFDDSGNTQWRGGIGGHGNKLLRCLLIEAAQSILRSGKTPLAAWGKRLLARKGVRNLAVAAMARKLLVAVWYLLMGRWTPLEEIDDRLCLKVGKIIGAVGPHGLETLGKTRQTLRQETYDTLLAGGQGTPPAAHPQPKPKPLPEATIYVLDPDRKFTPKAKTKVKTRAKAKTATQPAAKYPARKQRSAVPKQNGKTRV